MGYPCRERNFLSSLRIMGLLPLSLYPLVLIRSKDIINLEAKRHSNGFFLRTQNSFSRIQKGKNSGRLKCYCFHLSIDRDTHGGSSLTTSSHHLSPSSLIADRRRRRLSATEFATPPINTLFTGIPRTQFGCSFVAVVGGLRVTNTRLFTIPPLVELLVSSSYLNE